MLFLLSYNGVWFFSDLLQINLHFSLQTWKKKSPKFVSIPDIKVILSPEAEQINFSLARCYLFFSMQSSVCVWRWVINPNISILNLDAPVFFFLVFNNEEFCSHRNNIKDEAQWFSATAPTGPWPRSTFVLTLHFRFQRLIPWKYLFIFCVAWYSTVSDKHYFLAHTPACISKGSGAPWCRYISEGGGVLLPACQSSQPHNSS